jgi:3-phenylpropionate/cinnamic acid dioxygenase small subunit
MSEEAAGQALEIHHALARLAHLADSGELPDYLDLFTEDAVWETPAVEATGMSADRRVGRADIAAGVLARRAAGIQGSATATRHVVHTIDVRIGPDGTAASTACWAFYRSTVTAPELAGMGRYDDTWRLTGDGWKLAHRRITVG